MASATAAETTTLSPDSNATSEVGEVEDSIGWRPGSKAVATRLVGDPPPASRRTVNDVRVLRYDASNTGPAAIVREPELARTSQAVEPPSVVAPRGMTSEDIRRENRRRSVGLLPYLDSFVAERNNLVKKKFEQGLSSAEELRLQYVRWQLDRIDDVENGPFLDKLEQLVQSHERLAEDVNRCAEQLRAAKEQPHRRPKHSAR